MSTKSSHLEVVSKVPRGKAGATIERNRKRNFFVRVTAANGRIVFDATNGDGYSRRVDARNVMRYLDPARVVELVKAR